MYARVPLYGSRRTEQGNTIRAHAGANGRPQLTFMVPSSVLATTILSRASLASPVTHRSSFFLPANGRNRLGTFGGHGPILNVRRGIPDCMLYMLMAPVDDAVMPKLPHAVTHTACKTVGR